MAADAGKSHFWRDEADLWLLSSQKRTMFYISWLLSIGYLISFITVIVKFSGFLVSNNVNISDNGVLIAGILFVILIPALAICEMTFKGEAAGQRLMALKAGRTELECFFDPELHGYAGPCGFQIWKIGVRNKNEMIAANDVRLFLERVVAIGEEKHNRRVGEVHGISLGPTRRPGPNACHAELRTEDSFDIVEVGNGIPEDSIRIYHNTPHPEFPERIYREIGYLPLGEYRLKLRVECKNAMSKRYGVDINCTPVTGLTLKWLGAWDDSTMCIPCSNKAVSDPQMTNSVNC